MNIQIGNRIIGPDQPAYIIAELSCNHRHDYDIAVRTIYAMKEAGADCVKLQTAKPESITIDSDKDDFKVSGGTLWDGMTLFELYKEIHTPWEWHAPLQKLSHDLGMDFFSSPFDLKAVDYLENLDVPAYKIASFEITDIPLIKYAAKKGKPMIISTGVAMPENIADAVNACKEVGNHEIILLKCTSAYPTPLEEVNLAAIPLIRDQFDVQVGLSDHTKGFIVPVGAIAQGAVIIEKHFILDKSLGGPDADFSLEPIEFKTMVENVRKVEKAIGKALINSEEKVRKGRQFSRSLYVVEDVKEGEIFTHENVRSIRPGYGCHPKHLDQIIGKKATKDLSRGTPFEINFLNT